MAVRVREAVGVGPAAHAASKRAEARCQRAQPAQALKEPNGAKVVLALELGSSVFF